MNDQQQEPGLHGESSALRAYIAASKEYGRHSRIPPCCVAAYLADEASGVEAIGMSRDLEFGCGWRDNDAEYVPCRRCYPLILAGKKRASRIHYCDLEPRPNCERIKAAYAKAVSNLHAAHPERAVVLVVDPSWSTPQKKRAVKNETL